MNIQWNNMICPNCKNEMRQDAELPTIWYCNNSKCALFSIVITMVFGKKLPPNHKQYKLPVINIEEKRQFLREMGLKV